MPTKLYKILLLVFAATLLTGGSILQRQLVREREELGLSRYTEIQGAPPVLTLTTVALGGFRGLISNLLWLRATDLQDNDKFFEMMQLADWITKLEPHFTQVWLMQAWNMAYNISVKFKDPADRWRWVKAGIELLRDGGLRYNPNDVLMYRELSWFFQHKMGANLDDAHIYYKQMWLAQMTNVFGSDAPDLAPLLNPTNDEQRHHLFALTNDFKMDPKLMKEIDDHYGPLEWRLPEAHAIYWAALGLQYAEKNGRTMDTNNLMALRRSIFQSMQLSFQRGHLIAYAADKHFEFGPNLDIIPNVSKVYRETWTNEPTSQPNIENAHKNFLRQAIFDLYIYNKKVDAVFWYNYFGKTYPNKSLLVNSFVTPDKMSLDDYIVAELWDEIDSGSVDQTTGLIEGLLRTAYKSLVLGEEERYTGLQNLVQRAWTHYMNKVKTARSGAVDLPPLNDLRENVQKRLLNGELTPMAGAVLRTRLHLPPPTNAPPAVIPVPATNAPQK
jgi:hypothetical protein